MKYLKTKDGITLILGNKTVMIGRDDPRYELGMRIINGEETSEVLNRDKIEIDLDDFVLELNLVEEKGEVYFGGKYFDLPNEFFKWCVETVSQGGFRTARCVRSMMMSGHSVGDWSAVLQTGFKLGDDGSFLMEKFEEDELDGVEFDRERKVWPVRGGGPERQNVKVLPEHLTFMKEKSPQIFFTASKYTTEE